MVHGAQEPAGQALSVARAEQEELLVLLGESDITVQKLREELRFVYASMPDGAATT